MHLVRHDLSLSLEHARTRPDNTTTSPLDTVENAMPGRIRPPATDTQQPIHDLAQHWPDIVRHWSGLMGAALPLRWTSLRQQCLPEEEDLRSGIHQP